MSFDVQRKVVLSMNQEHVRYLERSADILTHLVVLLLLFRVFICCSTKTQVQV